MRPFLSAFLLAWALAATIAFTGRPEPLACAISLDNQNVLIVGLDNPANIVVRGVPEEKIQISASPNLSLKKERGSAYTIRASQPGEGTITVEGGALQPQTFRYRVKRLPDPVLRLGAQYRSGTIGNGAFKAQGGLAAVIENFDIDARCEMIQYKVTQLRNGQMLASAVNTGARYSPAVRAIIDEARPGDTYLLGEVSARCPGDTEPRYLDGLIFKIK